MQLPWSAGEWLHEGRRRGCKLTNMPRRPQPPRFPALAELFSNAMKEMPEESTLQKIVSTLKNELERSGHGSKSGKAVPISKSTLSAIFTGQRPPSPILIPLLGRFFYPDDLPACEGFIKTLRREVRSCQPVAPTRVVKLADLINGLPLRVRTVEYHPFCGTPENFLTAIMERLFRLSNIRVEQLQATKGEHEFVDIERGIQDGLIDFTVGVFSTLRRRLFACFLETPVRMAVSAVAIAGRLHEREALQKRLTQLSYGGKGDNVLPIVVPGNVGEQQVLSLGFGADEYLEAADKDAASLANMLITHDRNNRGMVPVVVADELMALRVLEALHHAGEAGFLVFPINSHRAISAVAAKRDSTEYFLSVCVSRSNFELASYFEDAMRFYLKTEIATTSQAYANAYFELTAAVKDGLKYDAGIREHTPDIFGELLDKYLSDDQARRWLLAHLFGRYVLSLRARAVPKYESSLPWGSILENTHAAVCQHISSRANLLYVWEIVRAVCGARLGHAVSADEVMQVRTHEWEAILVDLEDLFDSDLQPLRAWAMGQATMAISTYTVVCGVREQLAGRPLGLEYTFRRANDNDKDLIFAMLSESSAQEEWVDALKRRLSRNPQLDKGFRKRWLIVIASLDANSGALPLKGAAGLMIISSERDRGENLNPAKIRTCYVRDAFRQGELEAALVRQATALARAAGWNSLQVSAVTCGSLRDVYLKTGFAQSPVHADTLLAVLH